MPSIYSAGFDDATVDDDDRACSYTPLPAMNTYCLHTPVMTKKWRFDGTLMDISPALTSSSNTVKPPDPSYCVEDDSSTRIPSQGLGSHRQISVKEEDKCECVGS